MRLFSWSLRTRNAHVSPADHTPIPDSERNARIRRIVEAVARSRQAGLPIDISAVEVEHPHLMPDLRTNLHALLDVEHVALGVARLEPDSQTHDLDEGFELSNDLQDYRILERLDRGGQGTVYRAVHVKTKRTVAIKVLLHGPFSSEKERQRFSREIELISRLQHPNIVTLYDAGVARGRCYYVMEYIEGLSINDFVLLNGLDTKAVASLLTVVCQAVGAAHQQGVLHRDLKPSNILVDNEGQPHVLDFGLARDLDTPSTLTVCQTGHVIGTMPYMSPEQARGGIEIVDVRSDIYSLGIVLYELLTDTFPYDVQGSADKLRASILSDDPVRLRNGIPEDPSERSPTEASIDEDIENIVQKALSKARERRYQSAHAFADDLARYVTGDAVAARADSRMYLFKKTLQKYRVHVAVGALMTCLLMVFAVVVTMLLLQTTTQRDQATRIAQLAHATLDDLLNEVDQEIKPLPGGAAARERLTENVESKLAELELLLGSNAGLDLDHLVAATYRNQGDILSEKGWRTQAAERYERSLIISKELARKEPDSATHQYRLAEAHRKLAAVTPDYEAHYARAIDIESLFYNAGKPRENEGFELCRAYREFGRRLYLDARYQEADKVLSLAASVAEPNSKSANADDRWMMELASIYSLQGKTRYRLADREAATKLYQKSVAIRKVLIESHPANAQIRMELVESYLDIGDAHRTAGQPHKAIHYFEKAVEIGRLLVQMDPGEANWCRRHFVAVQRLGQELLKVGEMDFAMVRAEEAMTLVERLHTMDSANLEWQAKRASAYSLRGKVFYRRKEWQRAWQDFEYAGGLLESILVTVPNDHLALRYLSGAVAWQAKCNRSLQRPAGEGTCLRRVCELRGRLLRAQPDVLDRDLDLVNAQINLAAWHIRQRSEDNARFACSLLSRARDALVRLREENRAASDHPKFVSYMAAIARNMDLAGPCPHLATVAP